MTRTIGVLGGMGPLATARFYQLLVERTPAATDQEHVPVVIWADPRVPDRTAALRGEGPSPVPALVRGAVWLRRAGATVIAMPCNTAHAFVSDVAGRSAMRFLDMPSAAVRGALASAPRASRIGLLATDGTRLAQLYEQAAADYRVQICNVTSEIQRSAVEPAIACVKAGRDLDDARELITQATAALADMGADLVIAGCSEVPIVAEAAAEIVPVIDSVATLADSALRYLGLAPLSDGAAISPQLADLCSAGRTGADPGV